MKKNKFFLLLFIYFSQIFTMFQDIPADIELKYNNLKYEIWHARNERELKRNKNELFNISKKYKLPTPILPSWQEVQAKQIADRSRVSFPEQRDIAR